MLGPVMDIALRGSFTNEWALSLTLFRFLFLSIIFSMTSLCI